MSYEELLDILYSKPDYLSTPESELPYFIRRVKVPSNPLTKLKFEPNKIARKVFEFESAIDAINWRLLNQRINHRIFTGEPGEGKTSAAITLALLLTDLKKASIKKAKNIRFSIDLNLLLGQFITLRSQILYSKFRPYEEILVDEFELCANRMRSASSQNMDTKNTLDAGRFRYNDISGIAPSIGSLDKQISATKMQWNFIAEFNSHKNHIIEVIVKYNVHSRDNFEYRWVNFIEMEIEWCPSELFKEAEEIKRRMIATHEGLKSKQKHYAEEVNKIKKQVEKEEDKKTDAIVQDYLRGEMTREDCIIKIFTKVKASKNYISGKIPKTSWNTVSKVIKQWEKDMEEGKLTKNEAKEVIN